MAEITEQQALQQYKEIAMKALDEIQEIRLDISADNADYHRAYLIQKVLEASRSMGRLSDLSLQLTRLSLKTGQVKSQVTNALRRERDIARAGPEYVSHPLVARDAWLAKYLQKRQDQVDSWEFLYHLIFEVRKALVERVQTIKRQDSDLRLHQKLLDLGPDDSPIGQNNQLFSGKDLQL